MKHLLPARYLLTMLLACLMALGAQADPIKFYVSAKTGNDGRNGTSWNDAFKTLKAALNHVEISANPEAIVYMTEGKYDVGEVNAITYKDGKTRDAFYVMTKPGQKLTIAGGYPTPGSSTLPHDVCSSNPRQYITEFTSDRLMRNSVLRANNSNQSLILSGLTFNSKKFIAQPGQGAIITMDCNNFDNPYLELTDCVFNYYKSARHSAIYFYGNMKNPRVKINRVEVLQGEYFGAQGGGFLSFSDGGEKQTNVKVDISYVTFHDIHHLGLYQGVNLFGLTNHGEDPTDTEGSYVKIDHMQVDRNIGGTAENQQSTISLNGFKNVTITNSTFRNSQARKGGVLRMMNCQNMYLENNQFHNNFSGDRGGAIYVSTPNGIHDILTSVPEGTQRYITIKDCEFDKNRAGASAAVGDGGSLLVDDTNGKSPLNVTVENCNFKNGETTALEGAAMWVKVAGTVTVKNSMFCNNTTGTQGASGTGAGGAIRFAGAKTVLLEGCYFSDNASKKGGGAIELDIADSRFDVKNCVFANSTVTDGTDGGGVIYPSGGAVSLSSGHGTFTNCKFTNNKCNSYGGAVSIHNNQSNVAEPITFEKCEFVDNKANNGGAIGQINNGHTVIVKDCIFKKNHAYGVEKTSEGGGAIAMLVGCKGTQLIKNIFEGNTVVGKGGAVLALNAAFVKSNGNRYYNNEANQGGAICMNDATIEDNTSGLWSTNDVFFGNVAKKGNLATNIITYTLPGSGGALSILLAQGKNCIIKNSTFVKNTGDGIKGRLGSGGAIFYLTRTGLLSGDDNRFVIDSLTNCTFFGNQGMSNDSKMSTTVWGADISSHQTGYSYIRIFDSNLQLASNMYKSKLQLDEQSGNTYSYNEDPGTSATATPIDGQGYTMPTSAEMGAQGEGAKIDCKPIVERPEIDVLKPHANIITNDSKQPGVSKTFATYCASEKKYWAKFQGKGGEGPFTFTYDVWKQKGNSFEKIVTDRVAKTSTEKIQIPEKKIPRYDYTKPIKDEKGDTIDYEINGYNIIPAHKEYPDSVILTGEELFPIAKVEEGYLYTIIVKSMTDHDGLTYKYDCSGEYNLTREYGQNVGAQIFFKDCTLPKEDIDWDNDGIINIDENPELNPTNFVLKDNQLGTSKWVRYRPNVNTQKLFADIVKDENYLNATPKTGDKVKVLTLLPSVVGASSATGDPFTVDLSDKFGYAAGSGKVVVKIHNYKIDGDRFMTGSANKKNITTWEVSGTMHPYVLMQSTPASLFHIDNQFGINILTNEHAYSQTELYTKMDDDRYTVFESEGTKKVIVNNKDVNLKDMVGLSYLNVDPGTKYFAFTQTLDQTGEVNTLVTIMLPVDDDKDGVPNFLDPDSDGDGCFDAIEGGDNVTEDMVDEQGQIKGKEDSDGVPVAVNPGNPADKDKKQGQSRGSAYDPDVNACGYNYWTGDVNNDFNKKENWTKDVPKDGQSIIFADGSEKAKGKNAVRDLHLPAGRFISANKLVNKAPNEKFEEGATTKTAGHPAVVVPADGGLTVKSVEGFGTDGDKDKLVMKTSDDGKKVGTFILSNDNPCLSTVYATVEFKPLGDYVAGRTTTDNKDNTSPDFGKEVSAEFDWQYIGLPVVETTKNPTFEGMWVRAYDEKLNDANHYYRKWTAVKNTDKMKAFMGYEVAPVKEGSKGVHKIQGKLNLCEHTIELTRQASVVTAVKAANDNAKRYGLGYNIVGNSFMAGVDINNIKLASGEDGVKMDNTVYIYTTGSWDDWKNQNNGKSSKEKGGYEAVNISKAGENGIIRTLAPMQGFMVKYSNPVYSMKTGTLTIPYTGLKSEAEPLRAKSYVMEDDFNRGSVMVTMDNGKVVDKFWTYQEEDATPAYDSQLESEKLNMGEPSVFATTSDGKNVQISSLPSLIGSTFSVETAKGDTYNMELNAWSLNYQNLKLVDLKKETVTPFVDNKAKYFFTGEVDGVQANRFVFVDTPETDFAKILGSVTGIEGMTITLTKGKAELFNLSGAKMGTFSLPLDAQKLKGHVPAGVYLIKATDGTNVKTSKIVIE